MEMPLAEIFDRISILKLKIERVNEPHLKNELEYAMHHLNLRIEQLKKIGTYFDLKEEWINKLHEVNGKIWDLESDIRKGKEGELGLEEVGRRAIEIRNLNKIRISIKNEITEITGSGFKDVKVNHASQ